LTRLKAMPPACAEHRAMKTIPIRSMPAAAATPRPGQPARRPATWRLSWLFAAPHRLAFAAAALMLAASAAWWALAMLARSQGVVLPWALAPSLAHGLVMSLGFVPLFFAGFLFTAGPKWLGQPPVDAQVLLTPVLAMLAGWGVFGLGVHAREPAFGQMFGALGLCAVTVGWTGMLRRFGDLLRTSPVADQTHARIVAVAGLAGAAALWAATIGLATGSFGVVRAAVQVALWGFVGVVYLAVAHRMIPFFTASALPVLDAWRPMWLLWAFVGVLGEQAVFAVAQTFWWPLPAPALAVQALIEAAAGAALLALAVRWGLVQSLKVRLLAMLHLGFVWLGLALLMAGVSNAMLAASGGSQSLGLAPLHAYTMGFLGSTLIAMVTRVSCGHGGRALVADDLVWRLFWLLQLAVVARVGAALVSSVGAVGADGWIAVAALAWAACCGGWALRYGRWWGRPRFDGRPG
jgi:uncharacterized protein involved in response to NO